MQTQRTPGFSGLHFQKNFSEIIEKANAKISKLKAKIDERIKRIADLRQEYGIDDTALIELLTAARRAQQSMDNMSMSYSYTKSGPQKPEEATIGAGVVNNLLTENDFIESERDHVRNLEFITRNLKPYKKFSTTGVETVQTEFDLSKDELIYLGF